MRCPFCGSVATNVVDSRAAEHNAIRRRRSCSDCARRFTTYERYQAVSVKVRHLPPRPIAINKTAHRNLRQLTGVGVVAEPTEEAGDGK